MPLTLVKIIILAVIQGLAELLPVSSSAHVIVTERLMGLNPSEAKMTLLLVMLHTGTMFAVIVYFWKAWKKAFFGSKAAFWDFAKQVVLAMAITGIIALPLMVGIPKYLEHKARSKGLSNAQSHAEVEDLFSHLEILAGALAAAGVLILVSGFYKPKGTISDDISAGDSLSIGFIQGLAIPFRGFSRSGSTISVALLRNMTKRRAEEFSFALAVVLTPAAVLWEARRMIHSKTGAPVHVDLSAFYPSLLGMVFSFLAGLIALKLLSRLLEHGRWWIFGIYCLAASGGIFWMYLHGY